MSHIIKEQWRTDYSHYEQSFIAYRSSSHSGDSALHPMFHHFICQYVFNDDLLHHGQLGKSYYERI